MNTRILLGISLLGMANLASSLGQQSEGEADSSATAMAREFMKKLERANDGMRDAVDTIKSEEIEFPEGRWLSKGQRYRKCVRRTDRLVQPAQAHR